MYVLLQNGVFVAKPEQTVQIVDSLVQSHFHFDCQVCYPFTDTCCVPADLPYYIN